MHDRAAAATLIPPAPPAPALPPGRRCVACGYSLHGLPTAALCPECGQDPSELALPRSLSDGDVWWARGVAAGLLLLLVSSFVMLGVTAFMHFRSEWAGSLPVLNYPGPKLWGTALLQRSIGNAPGEWGVAGTRFGLLGLLAVWLITTPRPADRLGEAVVSLRRATRWVSLLGFGAMLGLLLGEDGVSYWDYKDRDVYFMLLLALVELPATALLYLYLRQIAHHLKEPALRQPLGLLSVGVPAVIGAAVVMILLGTVWKDAKHQLPQQIMVAAYGAAAVALGILGTAVVGRLTLLLAPLTIGGAARLGLRQFVLDIYRQAKLRALTQSEAWHRWIIVAGLAGWLLLSLSMLQAVLMLEFRTGPGGNWPMINVIAPKVWGVPLVVRFDRWFQNSSQILAAVLLMVGCLWLITIRRPGVTESLLSPRRLARWGPTVLVGVAIGIVLGMGPAGAVVQTHSIFSAFSLPLTMFVEGPGTLLVYLYLAILARGYGDARLARHLSWAGLLAVALIVGGNGMFLLSRAGVQGGPAAFGMIASYGLACVAVGLWSTWCILRLMRRLILPERPTQYQQLPLFEQS